MVIIGGGRIGLALQQAAIVAQQPCLLLRRADAWEVLQAHESTPILLAVRNDDLADVLARVPDHRRADLVFLQNGMLRPWLAEHGLQHATRGLIFFAVAKRGDVPRPGGESPLFGPHAAAVAAWLTAIGLPAHEVDSAAFASVELEKLLWNSVFGVLCQAFQCAVDDVVYDYPAELYELVAEYVAVAAAEFGSAVDVKDLVKRMSVYSLTIEGFRASVKEYAWRNGWFVAQAKAQGVEMPVHTRLFGLAEDLGL